MKAMKQTIILLISLLIVNYSSVSANIADKGGRSGETDSISIFSTPDLYNISSLWAGEYNKLFPGTKINVVSVSDAKTIESLLTKGQIGFMKNESTPSVKQESFWKVIVGRDVIVPVINSKNPFLDEINTKGVSPENLRGYLSGKDSKKWGNILGGSQSAAVNLYILEETSIPNSLSEFLGGTDIILDGKKVENSNALLAAIQKDPFALGFCKLIDVLDLQKQTLTENISLLPLDRNGNGALDYNEKIYEDYTDFSRGVWIGKYPKALVSNIYSVSSSQPESEIETAFLKWVLNDGQQFLYSSGYTDLLMTERQSVTDKLFKAQNYSVAGAKDRSVLSTLLIIVLAFVLAGFVIDFSVRYFKKERVAPGLNSSLIKQVLSTNNLRIPGGLFFDKTHTWAFLEQNGFVKVGIDDFIQHITGTITRIKLKNEGDIVKKGDLILSIIRNGKQLNLYSPVSGTIREKNNLLSSNASLVNSSPYNEGWVYRLEPSNWHRENQLLFMAEKHREFIKNEFSRLKDFLAFALVKDEVLLTQTILQDGGEIVDNTLSNLGPEVWEEFQTKFIDPSRQVWFHELF
jgi:glycine cleavage system H lipoate-binding protein/ABC-type phosphate transport system substrate-binding protein